MVVLLESSPISTEELWSSVRVTIGFLVTSLTKDLLLPIAQFGQADSSRKNLGGLNFFHLRLMGATVFLGTFNPLTSWLVFLL